MSAPLSRVFAIGIDRPKVRHQLRRFINRIRSKSLKDPVGLCEVNPSLPKFDSRDKPMLPLQGLGKIALRHTRLFPQLADTLLEYLREFRMESFIDARKFPAKELAPKMRANSLTHCLKPALVPARKADGKLPNRN